MGDSICFVGYKTIYCYRRGVYLLQDRSGKTLGGSLFGAALKVEICCTLITTIVRLSHSLVL